MILSGKEVKKHYLKEYKNFFDGKNIKVAIFENIYDPASVTYANQIKKTFKKANVDLQSIQIKRENRTKEDILNEYLKILNDLNNDDSITAIFIQFPTVGNVDKQKIIDNLSPAKDLEGITFYNAGKLFAGDETIVPPTAMAIIAVAEYHGINFEKKMVSIVNRSLIIGRPLIPLLLNRNATVTVCHSKTPDLKSVLIKSDIVISGAGKIGLIKAEYIKENAVVLDASINFDENGNMMGDAEYEEIEKKAAITPVPGGIGPVTNIMLLRNLKNIYLKYRKNL